MPQLLEQHTSNGNMDDRSLGELIRDLGQDASTLVQHEVALAKAEMKVFGARMAAGAGMLGFAAVCGLMALGALTVAAIAAFALILPTWAAALIVAGIALALGAIGIAIGVRQFSNANPTPERTIATLKDDMTSVRSAITHSR